MKVFESAKKAAELQLAFYNRMMVEKKGNTAMNKLRFVPINRPDMNTYEVYKEGAKCCVDLIDLEGKRNSLYASNTVNCFAQAMNYVNDLLAAGIEYRFETEDTEKLEWVKPILSPDGGEESLADMRTLRIARYLAQGCTNVDQIVASCIEDEKKKPIG